MKTTYYVTIKDFCASHEIKESFVLELSEHELIEVVSLEQEHYIHFEELPKLERILRLRQELDINLEGIGAIAHLLDKIESLQQEVSSLKRKLGRFDAF